MCFRVRLPAAPRRLARAVSSLALLALAALLLLGCGPRLVPFTHELRVQHNLSDRDVKNLQFYVSHRVALRRELESASSQITSSHKLLLVSGKIIEEVIVEDLTPGVAVAARGGALSVSFEPGASLTFSAGPEPEPAAPAPQLSGFATPPEPFPASAGPLLAGPPGPREGAGLGGSYWLSTGPGGEVRYQGKLFSAIDDSLRAHLLIDADSLEEVVERRTVLPGVRLPGR
ncbi:DNA-directed RNA polymerase [Sorangium cellulosum]|uniref:DNA-directed RNA polymerase n=1 Tax=Sorangium cellulosum TaxID=56 RepID=A0A2L0EKP6_SORCE|nr:DNA-directed RNA polymerase [Sorangium cellulosum]AUX39867.1 DNA-directed RNA polymerase [Sorangium cellulosum]